jgi:hypothetical protein
MNTLEAFKHAYQELGDALLKHVSLAYAQQNQPQITVVLECWSFIAEEWVYLEMRFSGVQEFRLLSNERYCLTVVTNCETNQFGNVVVFDFIPFRLGATTLAEHRESLFYIACTTFSCQEIKWSKG